MNPLSTVKFNDLKKFYNMTDDDFMHKTIAEILQLNQSMLTQKEQERFDATKEDTEFKNAVIKYFRPFSMLSQYWSTEEIVTACAKFIRIGDIRETHNIPVENLNKPETYADNMGYEYIGIHTATVRQYTKQGEELLYGKSCKCHQFYVPAKYQGLKHGRIILELLYTTYPALREFQFDAYEMYSYQKYEIYPKNLNCYTPLNALMSSDIDAIIKRNEDYCKDYNNGTYSTAEWAKRVVSPELQHYFDIIKSLKKGE